MSGVKGRPHPTRGAATPAPRRVGIREVAAEAGVSVGTVSNVLNRPDRVSDGVRRRVEEVITRLAFVRNSPASQLRAGYSRAIGLVVLDIGNPFFAELARGVEEIAADRGLSVLLCSTDGSAERERRHLQFLEEQRVGGLLITPVDPSAPARLSGHGMSVVFVDEPSSRHCSTAVDDRAGGAAAGRHLRLCGRQRLVYVTGPASVRQCQERGIGLRAGLRGGGGRVRAVALPALTGEAGHAAVPAVLAAGADGVFCANDVVALGVLRGLLEAGVRVPEDVALVGYDDIEFAATAAVPLTTVRQPARELGRSAARLLLDACAPFPDHQHESLIFQPELVVRRSSQAMGA